MGTRSRIRLGYAGRNVTLFLDSGKELRAPKGSVLRDSVTADRLRHNADALLKILAWNYINDIYVFRVNTGFISRPHLADYSLLLNQIAPTLAEIQALVRDAGMRITMHAVTGALGSRSPNAQERVLDHLEYCYAVLSFIGDRDSCIVLHCGSEGRSRFVTRERIIEFLTTSVSSRIRDRILLENDETWDVNDIDYICSATRCGFAYDYHHHRCWPGSFAFTADNVRAAIRKVVERTNFVTPKIHLSSQSPFAGLGKHAELIEYGDYLSLRRAMHEVECKVADIMIEATGHEQALLTLRAMVKLRKPRWITDDV